MMKRLISCAGPGYMFLRTPRRERVKTEVFWESLDSNFNESRAELWKVRTKRSLESKWGSIKISVAKFCGCVSKLYGLDERCSADDGFIWKRFALQTFTMGSNFLLMRYCQILQMFPKWKTCLENPAAKTPVKRSLEIYDPVQTERPSPLLTPAQPVGKKATKKTRRYEILWFSPI